jgi:hypothetical protein
VVRCSEDTEGKQVNGVFSMLESREMPKWYRALTISGEPAGIGFQCPKCHLGFRHSAPAEIFHCGAVEKRPLVTVLLPVRRLGEEILHPRVIPIGAW